MISPAATMSARSDPVRAMITPEGVDLRLRLAEVSQRASALILDLLILGASFLVMGVLLLIAALGAIRMGKAGQQGAMEIVGIAWLAGAFVLRNFYFIAFELGPRAATPGKRRMGIRVAARNGGRLTADAIFVRNAMRELELYLPMQLLLTSAASVDGWLKALAVLWCGVFVLLPLFNRDRLRAGDLLAGTWVVQAPPHRLLPDLARSGAHEGQAISFTLEQLDAYGIKELQVLENVLRRFDRKTIKIVADRIRAKIGFPQGEESDGAFLSAYYVALRHRLEARALLGRRRADKHDVG
jgi:uncharacterized RDD family membrane protein YckC